MEITLMKSMDFDKFKKEIKKRGYKIETTTKHHAVYTADGQKIIPFAVNHGKGQKQKVLGPYVRKVFNYLDQLDKE